MWSWYRAVSMTQPASASPSAMFDRSALIRAASKSAHRVSFIPTMTMATSGATVSAGGSCVARTLATVAPVRARVTNPDPDVPAVSASRLANPRHAGPGTGWPTPPAVESPSTTRVRTRAGRSTAGSPVRRVNVAALTSTNRRGDPVAGRGSPPSGGESSRRRRRRVTTRQGVDHVLGRDASGHRDPPPALSPQAASGRPSWVPSGRWTCQTPWASRQTV